MFGNSSRRVQFSPRGALERTRGVSSCPGARKTRQLEAHRLISHDLMQMSIRCLNNEIDSLNCCWKQNTSLLWITWHLQLEAGPDAALDEGVREQGCHPTEKERGKPLFPRSQAGEEPCSSCCADSSLLFLVLRIPALSLAHIVESDYPGEGWWERGTEK